MLYKLLIRPILFLFDPEGVHNFSFGFLRLILRIPGISGIIRSIYSVSRPELHTHLKDISLQNPIGLAAGFDKNALLGDQWGYWGFGFIEVGTVTPRPQDGNPKQRLFRLPKDKAVINRMGFNNAGLDALVTRLKRRKNPNTIIGANIGKNKDTPNEQAVDDYLICFKALFDYVDYFVVNVSSPNTPGLRSLQQKEPLTQLLQQLQNENQGHTSPKPLLLKIAPRPHAGTTRRHPGSSGHDPIRWLNRHQYHHQQRGAYHQCPTHRGNRRRRTQRSPPYRKIYGNDSLP